MSDCIEWWGTRDDKGYGVLYRNGKNIKAHRMVWAECFGDPGELYVLHHCDNPPCVNPEHLFVGTQRDNVDDMMRKGRGKWRTPSERTHCKWGHEFTPENTRYSPRSDRAYPMKVCRACATRRRREYQERLDIRATT